MLDHLELHAVHDLADRLEERERAVIRAHYGLGQPAQTLKEIGGSLGLTAERARQIEAGALCKLRAALAHPAPDARACPPTAAWLTDPPMTCDGHALRHNALVYGSAEEYVARAVAFLREGLAAGEGAIVANTRPASPRSARRSGATPAR